MNSLESEPASSSTNVSAITCDYVVHQMFTRFCFIIHPLFYRSCLNQSNNVAVVLCNILVPLSSIACRGVFKVFIK